MPNILNKIPIVYYHSVAPNKNFNWYKSYLTFSMIYFEDYLKYLKFKSYKFLFLDEYFELRKDPAAKNKKLICLTFDDGYLDNYVYVYPLLKKYDAKGTIFVSPDFVEINNEPRPTLEDVEHNLVPGNELNSSGFISWAELLLMQKSGIIDIQSHALTHTKYFISDKIREFHNPNSDYLNPIGNLYPDRKPFYISDSGFVKLIKYGYPFFEEKSSLIARIVKINQTFQDECMDLLSNVNWDLYNFNQCFELIRELYNEYKKNHTLITNIESQSEYEKRVTFELIQSKNVIENALNKPVNHLCWPNGDYDDYCHSTAIDVGYKSTAIVLNVWEENIFHDRFDRTGSGAVLNNRFLTLLKAKYKLGSYRGEKKYSTLEYLYNTMRYGFK